MQTVSHRTDIIVVTDSADNYGINIIVVTDSADSHGTDIIVVTDSAVTGLTSL